MVSRASSTSGRLSPRALRRRKSRQMAVAAAACLIILWSFGAGYLWRQFRVLAATPPVAVVQATEQEKAEALRLLDEAVRARHEGRWQGAMNALMAARRADPQAKGLNILVGEIALEQKDAETLRQAMKMASRSGENESSLRLLQSLQSWMQRGEKGVDHAGPQAEQALDEAAELEPSNAAVYFFHGELNRLLGDSEEAQANLLAALRRQAPWRSSALLEVKMQLAARDASNAGKPSVVGAPSAQAQAVLRVQGLAAAEKSQRDSARADLLRSMPLQQAIALSDEWILNDHYDTTFLPEPPSVPMAKRAPATTTE